MNRTNFNLLVLFFFFGIYFALDQLFFAAVQSRIIGFIHNRALAHIGSLYPQPAAFALRGTFTQA